MNANSRWYRPSVLEAAGGVSRWLGREMARDVADALGRVTDCEQLRAAEANLAVLTGRRGGDLRRLVRENLRGFLRTMADYSWCGEATGQEVEALLAPPIGAEEMQAAADSGKGVLLVTGHLGNWELGALHMARRLPKLSVVTLKEPTPELTEWRSAYRRRFGVETMVIGDNPFVFVDIVKALQRGETVAMLVDRPYADAAEEVEFAGVPALFSSGPATLWRLTGALVLPVFMPEVPSGRYAPMALPPVQFESRTDAAAEAKLNTQRLAAVFEAPIRERAAQWYQYVRIFDRDHKSVITL